MRRYSLLRYVRHVPVLCGILAIIPFSPAIAQIDREDAAPSARDVTFQTEDGWTLHGRYYLPGGGGRDPVPGVVVLSEPDITPGFIAGEIAREMAVLLIHMRGTGDSFGDKEYRYFTLEDHDAMQLDIRAAIKFLSSQDAVDPGRLAIFAANDMADYAAREAAFNLDQIKALVLSTGKLTDQGREGLRLRQDLPVLAFASEDDPREMQETSAEPYFLSSDKGSRLMFAVDRGASIFNRPGQPVERTTEWLRNNLSALGLQTLVSIGTGDGVSLKGTLYKPDNITRGGQTGGVVFVHGANHDATTWYHLAREVTKAGLAALIFDQRGYMKSTVKEQEGSGDGYFDGNTMLNVDTMQLDIKAAIDFLAAMEWVDKDRLALVTATSRAAPSVMASYGDPRVKALVGLSFYTGTAGSETDRALADIDIPLFMIASKGDMNADGTSLEEGTRGSYRLSKNKETELVIYDGAGRGSSILKTRPETAGMIVRWINEKLSR